VPQDVQVQAVRARLPIAAQAILVDGADLDANRIHSKACGANRRSGVDPRVSATALNGWKHMVAASWQKHHVITRVADGNHDCRPIRAAVKRKGNRVWDGGDRLARRKSTYREEARNCSTPVVAAHSVLNRLCRHEVTRCRSCI
jgi:hypothetical protein